MNPIVYNVMSAKYRAAFRKTLCGIQGAKATVGGGPPQLTQGPAADRLLPRYGSQISNGRGGRNGLQGQRRRSELPMPTQHNVMVLSFLKDCPNEYIICIKLALDYGNDKIVALTRGV